MSNETLSILSSAVTPVSTELVTAAVNTSVTETPDQRKRRLHRERDARYRANKRQRQTVVQQPVLAGV